MKGLTRHLARCTAPAALCLVAGCIAAVASDIVTRDGQTDKNAQAQKIEPDGITVSYTPTGGGFGVAKLRFSNLPEDCQRQFGYDAPAADAYQEAQREQRAEWARRQAERQTSQASENVRILAEIVAEYHKTHTYIEDDIFVCGDMASDVWNIVRTRGIAAKIQIGNVNADIESVLQSNHAWVLAEVSPGKWVALEATGGYVVHRNQNERYYHGHSFSNPRQLKEYSNLLRQFQAAVGKDGNARGNYNTLVEAYNRASGQAQSGLAGELSRRAATVDLRNRDVIEIVRKLRTLLQEED